MKTTRRPREVYLGRRLDGDYQMAYSNEHWDDDAGFESHFIDGFCPGEFEGVTGIYMEPGECVPVMIAIVPAETVQTEACDPTQPESEFSGQDARAESEGNQQEHGLTPL